MEKICVTCNISKPLTEYRQYKGYIRPRCNDCEKNIRAEKSKIYREANKEKLAIGKQEYYQQHKEEISVKKKEWSNKEHIKQRSRDYYLSKKEHKQQQCKEYYQQNKEALSQKRKEYRTNNKDKIKEQLRTRLENNPQIKIGLSLRKRVRTEISSGRQYLKYLGCTLTMLYKWFEFNFEIDSHLGLNWDNYGKIWSIDHVRPVSSFNLTEEKQIMECFNWCNTYPIDVKCNLRKNNKILNTHIFRQELRLYIFNKVVLATAT